MPISKVSKSNIESRCCFFVCSKIRLSIPDCSSTAPESELVAYFIASIMVPYLLTTPEIELATSSPRELSQASYPVPWTIAFLRYGLDVSLLLISGNELDGRSKVIVLYSLVWQWCSHLGILRELLFFTIVTIAFTSIYYHKYFNSFRSNRSIFILLSGSAAATRECGSASRDSSRTFVFYYCYYSIYIYLLLSIIYQSWKSKSKKRSESINYYTIYKEDPIFLSKKSCLELLFNRASSRLELFEQAFGLEIA